MSQVTITLSFNTIAEAVAFLAGSTVPTVSTVRLGNVQPDAAKPEKSKPAAKTSAPAAKGAQTDSQTTGGESPDSGVDYETEVKPLVLKLSALPGGGRDAVLATLKAFNAPKGSDVKAAQLPAFKEALEAKIAELEVA